MSFANISRYCGNDGNTGSMAFSGRQGDMIYEIFEWGWVSWHHRELGPQESLKKVVKRLQALTVILWTCAIAAKGWVLYVGPYKSLSWYLSVESVPLIPESRVNGRGGQGSFTAAHSVTVVFLTKVVGTIFWAKWKFKGWLDSLFPPDWCITQPGWCICVWSLTGFIIFPAANTKTHSSPLLHTAYSHNFSQPWASVYWRSPLKAPFFGLVEEEQFSNHFQDAIRLFSIAHRCHILSLNTPQNNLYQHFTVKNIHMVSWWNWYVQKEN